MTRKTREKEKVFLDTFGSFVSFFVIGVYSEINNITGFPLHLEIESFGFP